MTAVPALRVRVHGPFRGFSGHNQHTRAFVRELERQGVAVALEHLDGWGAWLPETERDPWFETLAGRRFDPQVAVHFCMPHEVRPEPGCPNVNYTMFEADRIPRHWVEASRAVDRVLLPTRAACDAWNASGVTAERVRLSPLGVDTGRFHAGVPPLPVALPDGAPLGERRFRFLNVSELRPRKNQLGLLRAWLRATRPDDDAALVLKLGVFADHALRQFQEDLVAMLQRTGLALADAAPVVFLAGVLPDRAMPGLFTAATHYVSLSCGEGWDLPASEAAASGLQLVVPRHSAYVDYLDDHTAHFVPARLAPAVFEGSMANEDQQFFDGTSWWPPDEEAAAGILRDLIDGRRAPTASAAAVIAERFDWRAATARLVELLREASDVSPALWRRA